MRKLLLLTLGTSFVLVCSFAVPKGGVQKTGKYSFNITDPSVISKADRAEIEEIMENYYGPQDLKTKDIIVKPWNTPEGIWIYRNKTSKKNEFTEKTFAGGDLKVAPKEVVRLTAILSKYADK